MRHGACPRRAVLGAAAAGIGAAAFSPRLAVAADTPTRRLRIAHLTDIHVQPEREASRGLAACFAHVQAPGDALPGGPPDLVITGGDTVMDAMDADEARTRLQWDLWRKVRADHCSLEVKSVLGNHDVWGWGKSKAKTTGDEPLYGKRYACEQFGRALPYESFDRGGWHIVLLDSTFPHEESYVGRLDDAQFDWLARDLAAVPATTPVLVVSHIPILSVYPLATGAANVEKNGRPGFQVSGQLVHTDHARLQALFAKHRNVKACLSGHLHVVERVEHAGVRYFCNGAVSSGWWRGLHRDTDFGYAAVDLFADGTVEARYVPYGWTAQA